MLLSCTSRIENRRLHDRCIPEFGTSPWNDRGRYLAQGSQVLTILLQPIDEIQHFGFCCDNCNFPLCCCRPWYL